MDNIQEYLESGILELYVYGALSTTENAEVARMLREFPELREEVEQIETTLRDVSGSAAPYDPEALLLSLKQKIASRSERKRKPYRNWPAIIGWAASILLLIGIFFMYDTNQELKEKITTLGNERAELQNEIVAARQDAEKMKKLLEVLRSRNIMRVPLPGKEFAPTAYATAYWSKAEDITYIDAQDLPAPPPGMVYQVWSLKLDPLTPNSIGLLENFEENESRIFVVENEYESEAFGITLEPAGGSKSPTLERLLVLGTISKA